MAGPKKGGSKPRPGVGMVKGGTYSPPNLMKTNPLRQQFEPTAAQPIRQRARMGGDPMGSADAAEMLPETRENRNTVARPMRAAREVDLQKVAKDAKASKSTRSEAVAEISRRLNEPVR